MIRSEAHGPHVIVLTIDRHQRRNALDAEHLHQLDDQLRDALAGGARSVVITGAGTAFSAGADLDGAYDSEFRSALYATLGSITQAEVPVVAALNGPAIGAGAQLAIACDLRVGGERAWFAIPTARNGLAVDSWTIRRLALLTNGSVARNLLLGAESIDADDARRMGLLSRDGDLQDAITWAQEIAAMAPLSLSYSKRALDVLFEAAPYEDDLDALFLKCWYSDDVIEGQTARAERRAPNFVGK
ncbi:enoyl-CoA hydratase [Nocardioides sp. NPDC047086]|uniref:enoyl-CoA hydratase n=1 Tax=Nocardioides sp. NPDC047086 TaxID=3154810 RepID=UPI0033D17A5D